MHNSVKEIALMLLRNAISDEYVRPIWDAIRHDVIDDVKETSAWEDEGYFNEDDVRLAIGRAFCNILEIEH